MFLWRRTVSYQSDQSKSISPLSGERVARCSRSLCSSCSSQIPLGNSSCWRLRKFHVLATSTRNLVYISLKWQDFFIIYRYRFFCIFNTNARGPILTFSPFLSRHLKVIWFSRQQGSFSFVTLKSSHNISILSCLLYFFLQFPFFIWFLQFYCVFCIWFLSLFY